MQVKILGSAAGGAFPQWNCACPNCHAVRGGQFQGKARSQTQVAVSADGESWFLLGASPDLRSQTESSLELRPRSGTRSSPIQGVVLASADLDHVLGLLLMRELQSFSVYAAAPVIQILRGNSVFAMLNRVPDQVKWQPIGTGESFVLGESSGSGSLSCQAIGVSSHFPAYATGMKQSDDATLGFILTAPSGATMGFFPQLARLTPALKTAFASLDCLLLDGTFWSDDELVRLQGSTHRARDMGHVPVGGADGTLQLLSGLTKPKPRKMYIHINNTNPMLNEAGAEYRAVRDAGWELAEDGCHFTL
ncbi:MAG TPA: pyrroloquinoline quinone biosynthesis protein PqqB [Terriglobales bacterium]|jgi:pyrroloquinoline quinone biosynthesis protein B|nr:pyrroloquinoline quinone biosynthesis protein PqqB [Terriglobales bacterium]